MSTKSNEELFYYQRRLCLRIYGIDLATEDLCEPSDHCLQKAEGVFDKLGVEMSDNVIDRPHRVGSRLLYDHWALSLVAYSSSIYIEMAFK